MQFLIEPYWDDAAGRVAEFTPAAQNILTKHRQLEPTTDEAGGILLGRILDGGVMVVDTVTGPGGGDRATRFGFRRSKRRAQRAVDRSWHESAGYTNYLGEWHTHPEDVPNPSHVDLGNWSKILVRTQCEQDSLLFLIVGRLQARLWLGQRVAGAIIELLPTTSANLLAAASPVCG